MAFSYPLPLPVLADRLPISAVTWDVKRLDEISGSSDGRIWQSEMASPKWTAEVELDRGFHSELRPLAAIMRKLHGSQEAFLLFDPVARFPAADPLGTVLGAAAPNVQAIASTRGRLRVAGLPSGYRLTAADKGSIAYGSNPTRLFFFEFSEPVVAASNGITPEVEVFPHIPAAIAAGAPITLARPACRMILLPDTFAPGRSRRMVTEGMRFKAIERIT